MKKMNVKSILHTSFVIMVALTVFIGSIGIYSVNEMTKRDRAMVDYTPVVYSLGLMMEYFQKINAELYQLAIWSHYGETGEMNKIGGNIESYIEIINAAKDEYLETSFDEVLEWNFYEAKRIFEDEYLPFVSEARLSLGKAGGLKAAVDIIVTGAGHYERLEELWNASIEDNIKWHYDEIIANENVARIALRTQAGAVSFSIVASVFFAIYLSRRIKKMDETIKAQAEHIENENERMRILLDTSPVACRLFNKKYEIFECNGASIKLFQLRDKQEFMADYYNFSPEYQPDGQSSLEKAKLLLDRVFAGEELVVDWLHQLSDGTLLPSEITLRLARYGGEEVVAGYTRDLREQNRMLGEIFEANEKIKSALIETQNANDAKSSFLASMSHEMRTPLNAIIGLSGLRLENGGLDDETASYLERINSAGGMLLKIVNDILDISKIEAGKMELVEFDYDVPSLINDAVTQNFVRIGEKQIELQLEIDESV
ncbi:MAG: MCP four helix bundle domain-containing protein, partial [Defluviitaleaceae bacterium]|nr:MCP four helix bundle domain-containing protein [Defluviitaleaceae bacterium]